MGKAYITDRKGKKISVVLPLREYQKLLEAKEELEDIRLYDRIKAKKEKRISLEDYLLKRKKKNAA